MQGKHIIGISILSLVIVGILYFTFQKQDEDAQQILNDMMEILKESDNAKQKSMKEILSQEIDENVLFELYINLCEKNEYGMALSRCNEVEKTFYLLYDFNAEVGNGGIEQFLYNCFENRNITLDILKDSSLKNSYLYLSQAIEMYPNERVEMYEDNHLMDALGKLDNQYYDLHEQEYYNYIYDYVAQHKDSFIDE